MLWMTRLSPSLTEGEDLTVAWVRFCWCDKARNKKRTAVQRSVSWLRYATKLCVDAALLDGERHAVDGQHVGGDAVVDVVGLGVADHVVEAVAQDGLQLLVDDGFFPEIALAVLYPLEVAGGDAAGVGQNVGHDEDALVGQDLVGNGGGGSVCAFHDDASLDLVRVAAGNHVLGGRRNEDVAVGDDQLFAGHGLRAAESKDGSVAILVFDQLVDIDAVWI